MISTSVRDRQDPLIARYLAAPEEALIFDQAKATRGVEHDPFHGEVVLGRESLNSVMPYGIHHAVGGDHDLPNPGDLLCGALASCLDSTIRIIAQRLKIKLNKVEVEVKGHLDVKGTLRVDRSVPIGFQELNYTLTIEPVAGTNPLHLQRLITAAEYSCVNLQTLKSSTNIRTTIVHPA